MDKKKINKRDRDVEKKWIKSVVAEENINRRLATDEKELLTKRSGTVEKSRDVNRKKSIDRLLKTDKKSGRVLRSGREKEKLRR